MQFIRLVTLAALAIGAAAQSFMINTPLGVVVCQPVALSWIGGTPPYFLSIVDGNNPDGPAVVDLGTQQGTSLTWQANQAVGTVLSLRLKDNTGALAQSGQFTIQSGSDTSCIGQSASTGGATTGGSSTSAVGATTSSGTAGATTSASAPAGTTSAPAGTTTSAPAGTTSTRPSSAASGSGSGSASGSRSSAAASGSQSGNAARATNVAAQMGAAGVVGAAVLAILA